MYDDDVTPFLLGTLVGAVMVAIFSLIIIFVGKHNPGKELCGYKADKNTWVEVNCDVPGKQYPTLSPQNWAKQQG